MYFIPDDLDKQVENIYLDGVEVIVDRNIVTLKIYQKEPWKFKVSDGGLANTWKQKIL